jgi:DNA-binding GntR family transcriptional regulator
MAEKETTGADRSPDFGLLHGELYDVLALLEGACALSAQENGSGNSVVRILREARVQLEDSINAFDAWDLAQRTGPNS